ncbi:hypothetical protein PTTG_10783 [Puccinia triticina 1-1 BBBD Race 1]|uniref:Uncharacterized protein n=1 Tax=Puccinia triticina (isolate 1-1 / race 1 (BBBD)) TaxID=630390 RepID=A0A180GVF5_PUCT1|nr:hypothetical protein PTTG_10783 [Puccinia triticina 1-1 BBBD Race 1]
MLYQETKVIVRSPESCKTCGRPPTLSSEECQFMVELVRSEPGLFLEEMQQRLFDSTGTLLSIQAIHENLVNRLSITLEKPSMVNSRKSLVVKFAFVEQMEFFPTNFLFLSQFPFPSSYDVSD